MGRRYLVADARSLFDGPITLRAGERGECHQASAEGEAARRHVEAAGSLAQEATPVDHRLVSSIREVDSEERFKLVGIVDARRWWPASAPARVPVLIPTA